MWFLIIRTRLHSSCLYWRFIVLCWTPVSGVTIGTLNTIITTMANLFNIKDHKQMIHNRQRSVGQCGLPLKWRPCCLKIIFFFVRRCELALVESDHRNDFARRCVEEAHPGARNLVAVRGGQGKADFVDALQVDLERRKQEVWRTRRRAVGDGEGFL